MLQRQRALPLNSADFVAIARPAECAAALNYLARSGQVIYDLAAGVYRWRQIMPSAVGESELGPEPPELLAAREITRRREMRVVANQSLEGGICLLQGELGKLKCEVMLDADGRMKRAKCGCSHFFKSGLRQGPCRHLLALRDRTLQSDNAQASLDDWFTQWLRWAQN